jgi:hypothetical protein
VAEKTEKDRFMGGPTCMTDLRDRLSKVYGFLEREEIDVGRAKELANVAGKMIKSAVAQADYAAYRKEIVDIPFMK